MVGSLSSRSIRTAILTAFALTVLLSAQAQAQSIVGTWETQGSDWVWFFDSSGLSALAGTGIHNGCGGITAESGTYTASAGSFTLTNDPTYWCNGDDYPQTSDTSTSSYVLSGDTLTFTNISVGDAVISTRVLTRVPSQTKDIVGTWNALGTGQVIDFQSNGQYVLTGSDIGSYCTSAGTEYGTYSASAGVLNLSSDSYTCDGLSFPSAEPSVQVQYAFSGNTLILIAFPGQFPGQNEEIDGLILSPQGGQATTIDRTTPLPPPQVVQSIYTAPSGQLPTDAVSVIPDGTFGNATLTVTLDLSKVLAGGSFTGKGQFAAGYNIYAAALVPSGVLGLPTETWFVYPSTLSWTELGSPIAAYMEGIAPDATNMVEINLLQSMDVTGLVGSEIYIGYGTSDTEMLEASRYRGVYKVQ